MPRPRLLLADDHALLLEGYRKLLEEHFEIVGVAADGRELLHLAATDEPDLVLLDISMPVLNGIDAARRLSLLVPKTKVLVVSMHDDPDYVVESFRAGASGYVLKRAPWSELLHAINAVLAGERFISPMLNIKEADVIQRSHQTGECMLTLRQREVLQLVSEGRNAREIAGVLKVSVKTVEFHKARIMHELGIRSVAGLTRYALRHGLLT